MDSNIEATVLDSTSHSGNEEKFSYYQPVWQYVLFSVLTFGLYDIYWYYKNWKHLKVVKNLTISPGWRTAGLFVPIWGIYLIYRFHSDYQNLVIENDIDRNINPIVIVIVVIISSLLVKLPGPYSLLAFINVIALAQVQSVLNRIWLKIQPEYQIRTKLRGSHIIMIVIGSLLWGLVILGMLIPS